jgi:DNA-binding NtrC family response regulator
MPHMDGEEAFREIRRIQPDASVILASGYSEQDVVSRFVGKGLAGFIQKPFQIAILQDSLQKHFESHPVAQTKHQGT